MPGDRLPDGPDVIMQSDSRGHPNDDLDTDDIVTHPLRRRRERLADRLEPWRTTVVSRIGADATAVITLRHYLE